MTQGNWQTHRRGNGDRQFAVRSAGVVGDWPNNTEAEECVVGSVLMNPECIHDVAGWLKPEHFWRSSVAEAWRAILGLYAAGRPIDGVSLAEAMRRAGTFDDVGGHDALSGFMAAAPSPANIRHYAGIVREKWVARELKMAALAMADEAVSNRHTADELVDNAQAALFRISEEFNQAEAVRARSSVADAHGAVLAGRAGAMGISTGIRDLDLLVDGLKAEQLVVIGARPSIGKAQPLDRLVLTPSGFVEMGTVTPGSRVIGSDGRAHRVLAVYPQGVRQVFRVTMSDGTATECCDEHLWFTQTRAERRRGVSGSVRPLSEIRASLTIEGGTRPNHRIPIVSPVEFDGNHHLPVDPYLLGILLGDGSFSGSVILHNPEIDIQDRFSELLPVGDSMATVSDGITCRVRRSVRSGAASETKKAIVDMGLDGTGSLTKFIPRGYLMAPVECRRSLLAGLVDTDGHVASSGRVVEFSTSSERLARDVEFLVGSLGGIVTTARRETSFTYLGGRRNGSPSFRLFIRFTDGYVPVRSDKHLRRWNSDSIRQEGRSIVSVDPVGEKPCQCIMIDSDDHLYVTDDFILTHNTALGLNLFTHCVTSSREPAVFVSLEMTNAEIGRRLLVATSRVDNGRLRNHEALTAADREALAAAEREWAAAPALIDDSPTIGLAGLMALARRWKSRVGLKVMFVDYLQLVQGDGNNRQEEIASVSRTLKRVARECEVAVVCLSQLNRNVEQREDKRPRLSDIRESGATEQDADVVLLMHRPDYYKPTEKPGYCELVVAKNRNGPTGSVDLRFRKELGRFEPWDEPAFDEAAAEF